jgi:hypothetical protein
MKPRPIHWWFILQAALGLWIVSIAAHQYRDAGTIAYRGVAKPLTNWVGLPTGAQGVVGKGQVSSDDIPSTPDEELHWLPVTHWIGLQVLEARASLDLDGSSLLTAAEANARYGIPGHLRFAGPVHDDIAAAFNEERRAALLRAYAIARRPPWASGRDLLDILVMFADPVVLAAPIIAYLLARRLTRTPVVR